MNFLIICYHESAITHQFRLPFEVNDMKNTKVILSAVMLAALVSCTSNQSAKQQREFCEQSKLFDNICHDGDHVSSEAKANDKGPSGQPDKETTITAAAITIITAITTTITTKKIPTKVWTAIAITAALTTNKHIVMPKIKPAEYLAGFLFFTSVHCRFS